MLPNWLRGVAGVATRGMRKTAQRSLSRAQGVIAVSTSYLCWGLEHAGRAQRVEDGVFPIGFTKPAVSTEEAVRAKERLRAAGVDESRVICWYIGSFGRTYDLEPVIAAARTLLAAGRRDVQFVFSGRGELGAQWQRLAKGLDNVLFTGWIDAPEAEWLRSRAAVGLQPYAAGAPQGLSNKLFEYLSGGMPVVSSLQGESEALLKKEGCGLTYPAGDARICTEMLMKVIDDPQLRRQMGERARAVFRDRFDGTVIARRLSEHLETIVSSFPQVT